MESRRLTLPALLLFSFAVISAEPEVTPESTTETQTQEATPETSQIESQQETEASEPESTIVDVTPYKQYVTDQLFIFMHSGSSNRYRIIDRLLASTQLTVLAKDEETGYLKVQTTSGKEGWVDAKMLTNQEGVQAKYAAAQEQVATLSAEVNKLKSTSTSDVDQLTAELTDLRNNNQQLSSQLETTLAENEELKTSLEQIDETQKILAKLYDAGMVILGFFVGWLLTRRKSNQWV